jgi:DNA polymerase-3 subunit beta
MKLTLSRQKIVEALSVVCKAITKNSLPVLQYVNLGFNENILILRATNLDLTIIKTIRPENLPELLEPNQSKLLPGSVVLALLSKSAEDKVTFCWEKQDNGDAVRLQFGSHKSQIKNIPPVEDFPLVPEVKSESFSVSGLDLERLLSLALPFASTETPQSAFNGVSLKLSGNQISVISTDRHRLASIKLNLERAGREPNEGLNACCVIPKGPLRTVLSVIGDDKVEVSLDDQFISFMGSDWRAFIRLIQDSYPDTEGIMPLNYQLKAEFDRDSLMRALKLCSHVSAGEPSVELHFGERFSVDNQGIFGEAFQPFEGQILEGQNLPEKSLDVIRINWQYLHDIARQIPSRYIILETEGYAKPVKIYGKTQPANWDETYILMPVRREDIEQASQEVQNSEEQSSVPVPAGQSSNIPEENPETEPVCGECALFGTPQCESEVEYEGSQTCEAFRTNFETIPSEDQEAFQEKEEMAEVPS